MGVRPASRRREGDQESEALPCRESKKRKGEGSVGGSGFLQRESAERKRVEGGREKCRWRCRIESEGEGKRIRGVKLEWLWVKESEGRKKFV